MAPFSKGVDSNPIAVITVHLRSQTRPHTPAYEARCEYAMLTQEDLLGVYSDMLDTGAPTESPPDFVTWHTYVWISAHTRATGREHLFHQA